MMMRRMTLISSILAIGGAIIIAIYPLGVNEFLGMVIIYLSGVLLMYERN